MEQKGAMLQWRLTLAETFAFGVTIATSVYFVTEKFQSKDDAAKLERRIERVESEITSLRFEISSIAKDTAYIRERIEPKEK